MRMFLSLGSSFTTSSVYSNIPSATAATTTASAVAHQVRISDSPVRWRIKLSLCVFLRAVGAPEWKIAFKMTKNSREEIPFKLWMYASKVLIWCKSQARNAEVLYVCAQHVYCVLWLEIRMLDVVIYKRILKAFVMWAKVQLKLQYFCLWVREEIHRKWMLLGSSFDHRGFIWHRTWVCVMFSDIRTSWKDEIVPTYCYSALRGVLSFCWSRLFVVSLLSRILAAITLWDRVSSLSTTLFLPATCLLGYLTVMTTVAVQVLLDIQQWNQRRPPQLDCLLEVFGFSLSFAFYLFSAFGFFTLNNCQHFVLQHMLNSCVTLLYLHLKQEKAQ